MTDFWSLTVSGFIREQSKINKIIIPNGLVILITDFYKIMINSNILTDHEGRKYKLEFNLSWFQRLMVKM